MSETGYIADQPWQHTYHRALAPQMVRFAAAMAGVELPAIRRVCELAYGQGLAVLIHAACNPEIEFAGTDFNAGHASAAAELAAAAGLRNLTLAGEDLAAFVARADARSFDVVAIMGTWSWLPQRDQDHIAAFLERTLAPGGVFCLDHCTLPGMNAFAGLVRMLAALSGETSAGSSASVERIPDVLARTLAFMDTNPQFVGQHWGLRSTVEALRDRNPSHVAHEYFNYNARPAYFTDTAALLARAGLAWCAPWSGSGSIDALHLTPRQAAFLSGIADKHQREQLRDLTHNTARRMDIWSKHQPGDRRARADLVADMHFVLSRPADSFDYKASGMIGEVALARSVYGPLLEALAAPRPMTAKSLADALGHVPLEEVCDALAILVDRDMVQVVRAADGGRAEGWRTARALNSAIIARAPDGDDIGRLGSPLTGAGLKVARHHQVFMLGEQEGVSDAAALARFAATRLKPAGGRTLPPELSSPVLVEREAETYLARHRPVYAALGVVEPR